MPDDPHAQKTSRPSGRWRLARLVVVFVLVVAVAALLGRFGGGIDAGPAVGVDPSASAAAAVVTG